MDGKYDEQIRKIENKFCLLDAENQNYKGLKEMQEAILLYNPIGIHLLIEWSYIAKNGNHDYPGETKCVLDSSVMSFLSDAVNSSIIESEKRINDALGGEDCGL